MLCAQSGPTLCEPAYPAVAGGFFTTSVTWKAPTMRLGVGDEEIQTTTYKILIDKQQGNTI